MKSLPSVIAAWLVAVGAANAGEIVLKPKPSDGAVVLRIGAGKTVEATPVEAPGVGEIVIKPKASDSAVVLTLSAGKLVKASVRAKPEDVAKRDHAKDTAVFARTP